MSNSALRTPHSAFALIGWPLGHSFSKKYFSEKFAREGIADAHYELFPLEHIGDLPGLVAQYPDLKGLNVTIPHKETVIPFLDALNETAHAVGAVNCIKIDENKRLTGYNTDVIGFEQSLTGALARNNMAVEQVSHAYILGTGGAAKAVAYVLKQHNIPFKLVSRTPDPTQETEISYTTLPTHHSSLIAHHSSFITHHSSLIINCTPLGTFPNDEVMPPIPIEILKPGILVFDLVYNPAETLLLREARAHGCFVQNGLEMLHLQAEAAWEIWQT